MSCLGLVFLLMGPVLLAAAWMNGRSLILAAGSVAYIAVGAWLLTRQRARRPPL